MGTLTPPKPATPNKLAIQIISLPRDRGCYGGPVEIEHLVMPGRQITLCKKEISQSLIDSTGGLAHHGRCERCQREYNRLAAEHERSMAALKSWNSAACS